MFVYWKMSKATNTMNENKTKLKCKWRNRNVVVNVHDVDWNNQLESLFVSNSLDH